MNSYEHTFITRQDVSDTKAKNLISKYEEIIKNNLGEVLKVQEWGLRILSHKIKKNRKGIYFHIKLNGEGKTIHELEKAENIDDALIRYLTIKIKKHDLEKNYFEKRD